MSALAYGSGLYGAGEYLGHWLFRVWFSTDGALWGDKTSDVRAHNWIRGHGSEQAEVDTGAATLVLDNRERWYDPAFNTIIRPMNRWKLEVMLADTTIESQFVGYAESYDQTWPGWGGSDAECVVALVDEFKVLALDKLPTMNPPRNTYEELIMFDEPHGYWRFDDGDIAAGAIPKVGAHLVITGGPGATQAQNPPSPIVGDPGKWLNLPAGISLSTVVQELGECGDVAGLSEFAVEFWLSLPDFPVITTPLLTCPVASTIQPYQVQALSGDVVVRVVAINSSGTERTVDSGTLTINTWYHVVATISTGSLRLYIDGTQVASTAWTGAFPSALTESPFELGSPSIAMDIDELAVYRHGITASRVLAHYEAGRERGFGIDLPGDRVDAVLDSIGSTVPRNVQSGTRTMQPTFMHGQDPLGELRRSGKAESVDALLFIARDGAVSFLADGYRSSSPYNTVQVTFDDDGTDSPYLDMDVDYSDAFLANEWNVTRAGGLTQSASDSTSIDEYEKRPQSLTDLPIMDDGDAQDIADAMVAKYAEPMTRINSLTLDTSDPAVAEAVFGLDIGDRIRILRTPPGGGARIDQTSFVQKIDIEGANDGKPWSIRLGVSPL